MLATAFRKGDAYAVHILNLGGARDALLTGLPPGDWQAVGNHGRCRIPAGCGAPCRGRSGHAAAAGARAGDVNGRPVAARLALRRKLDRLADAALGSDSSRPDQPPGWPSRSRRRLWRRRPLRLHGLRWRRQLFLLGLGAPLALRCRPAPSAARAHPPTIQSDSRMARLVPWSIERALRTLHMEYADFLLLGLWNPPAPPAILMPPAACASAVWSAISRSPRTIGRSLPRSPERANSTFSTSATTPSTAAPSATSSPTCRRANPAPAWSCSLPPPGASCSANPSWPRASAFPQPPIATASSSRMPRWMSAWPVRRMPRSFRRRSKASPAAPWMRTNTPGWRVSAEPNTGSSRPYVLDCQAFILVRGGSVHARNLHIVQAQKNSQLRAVMDHVVHNRRPHYRCPRHEMMVRPPHLRVQILFQSSSVAASIPARASATFLSKMASSSARSAATRGL